jgi:hypothetical protein
MYTESLTKYLLLPINYLLAMNYRCALLLIAYINLSVAFAEVEIPAKTFDLCSDIITAELKGRAVALAGKATVTQATVYEGTAFTPDVEFTYQIFPSLGVFRICKTRQKDSGRWLFISTGKIDIKQAALTSGDGSLRLNPSLAERILSCASGMLFRDVTMAELTCREIPKYNLFEQKINKFVGGSSTLQILIDSKNAVIAVNSSNYWKDAK